MVATGSCIQVACNDSNQAVAAKYHKAWEEIKKYPNTCRYFKLTETQLQLIVHSGYNANDAFEAAGDHDWPCHSCMANQQREDCFFNHIARLTEDAMKKKDEHPTMAQESLCKYMYDIFVKKEYSYLHSLTSECAIM